MEGFMSKKRLLHAVVPFAIALGIFSFGPGSTKAYAGYCDVGLEVSGVGTMEVYVDGVLSKTITCDGSGSGYTSSSITVPEGANVTVKSTAGDGYYCGDAGQSYKQNVEVYGSGSISQSFKQGNGTLIGSPSPSPSSSSNTGSVKTVVRSNGVIYENGVAVGYYDPYAVLPNGSGNRYEPSGGTVNVYDVGLSLSGGLKSKTVEMTGPKATPLPTNAPVIAQFLCENNKASTTINLAHCQTQKVTVKVYGFSNTDLQAQYEIFMAKNNLFKIPVINRPADFLPLVPEGITDCRGGFYEDGSFYTNIGGPVTLRYKRCEFDHGQVLTNRKKEYIVYGTKEYNAHPMLYATVYTYGDNGQKVAKRIKADYIYTGRKDEKGMPITEVKFLDFLR